MWSTGARIALSIVVVGRRRPDTCLIGYIADMASTWSALADPHRRAVLRLLLERPRPAGEIVERLGLSQPGTSKHLRILREAGLVRARPQAQRRVYELDPAPLAELADWLAPYRAFWEQRLDALGRHLDDTDQDALESRLDDTDPQE
jgi:DNA-binding transcriptional ArsR family regulator